MRRNERLILVVTLLIALVFRSWGVDFVAHPGARFQAPLFIALGAGVVTVWLVYQLAGRLFDRLTALTAAFFLATAYLHARESHFASAEVTLAGLAVAAVIVLTSAVREPARLIRWIAGGVLAASALAVFLRGSFQPLSDTAVLVPGRAWSYHLTFSLWYGVGGPLLIVALAGFALIVLVSWKKALVVGVFPLLYYFVVCMTHTARVRSMAPLVPFVSVTAAFGLVWTVRRFANEAVTARIAALLAIVLALPSIARIVAFDVLIARPDTRVLTADWIAAHVKSDETVGQIPPVLIYSDDVQQPANVVTFDVNRQAFLSVGGEARVPDWIIVPTSPLRAYTVNEAELGAIANTGYVRATSIVATHGVEPPEWFDQQDLLFMPYTTFTMRDRPGPEIQIFRRQR